MIALESLKTSGFFEEIKLSTGEVLFQEGDTDEYLYLIYDGELCIKKSISSQKDVFKILSLLGVGNIIGEGSLSQILPKEVCVSAQKETILLRIHGKNIFPKFVEAFPKEAYSLLLRIIELSNSRLLETNMELIANHEVSQAISEIQEINMKAIIHLLSTFQSIMQADEILYFEKNIVLDNYFKLKYHSQTQEKLQNIILKFKNNTFSVETLTEEGISLLPYFLSNSLLLGEKNHGFLVVARAKKDFHENEEKLLQNIATSFVGVIHQKEIQDEQKNKLYIKDAPNSF